MVSAVMRPRDPARQGDQVPVTGIFHKDMHGTAQFVPFSSYVIHKPVDDPCAPRTTEPAVPVPLTAEWRGRGEPLRFLVGC